MTRYRQYNTLNPVDIGYVIIPTNVDRDEFVEHCFAAEQISIAAAGGKAIIHNCYIDKFTLQQITFPKTSDELGDAVIYNLNGFDNKPIIVGVLSRESQTQMLEEGEFKLERTFGEKIVSINGRAKTGVLNINISDIEDGADFVININGSGSKFTLNVEGEAVIYSDDKTSLISSNEIQLKSINNDDESVSTVTVLHDEIIIYPNKVLKIGEGKEPILLGDETVKQLQKELKAVTDILNSIKNLVPSPVPAGSVDPTWSDLMASIGQITDRGDYSNTKSEVSFTD